MKRFFKILSLLIAFSVEIRIHAKNEVLLNSCKEQAFGESLDCAVMNPSHSSLLKEAPGVKMSLGKGAVASAVPGVVKWVKGEGVIYAHQALEIQSRFAHVICEKKCVIGFGQEESSLTIHALSGELQVLNFNRSERMALSEGGSLKVTLVGANGKSGWSQPYSLPKSELKTLTSKYLKHLVSLDQARHIYQCWEHGLERYSKLYQDRASRAISNFEQSRNLERKKREALEREDRELRELFRKKSLLD